MPAPAPCAASGAAGAHLRYDEVPGDPPSRILERCRRGMSTRQRPHWSIGRGGKVDWAVQSEAGRNSPALELG